MALLALGACGGGDPAKQQEVDMQGGEYEVTLAGAPMGFAVAAQQLPKRCVHNSPANIPTALVRPYMALHDECSGASFQRQGNQLTGKAVCPLNPNRAEGSITLLFKGTIAADGISGTITPDINMEANDPETELAVRMLKNLDVKFTAKRTGECTGGDRASSSARSTTSNAEFNEGSSFNE